MRKVLYVLGQLHDRDVDWMARNGRKQEVAAGTVLIHEGKRTPAIYFLLDGSLSVTVAQYGEVARLGPGEVVGEMSLIDSAPPSATVTAHDASIVLALDREALNEKIAEDDGFARRFYKALAIFLADRLRGTVRHLGYGAGEGEGSLESDEILEDELDEGLLDSVSNAGDRFNRMLKTLLGAPG